MAIDRSYHHRQSLLRGAQRRQFDRDQRLRREKQHEDQERALETDLIETAVSAMQALEIELRDDLERYQQATIEALIENERAMERVRERIAHHLENAYTLPDGRRVFKSEDGVRVFDEFGQAVGAEELDPNAIGDERPTWEAFQRDTEELERLREQRQELTDYQEKLDEARDRLDEADLTRDELDDIRNEIEVDMPLDVRRVLVSSDRSGSRLASGDLKRTFGATAPVMAKAAIDPSIKALVIE